jgi:hypothetical protein
MKKTYFLTVFVIISSLLLCLSVFAERPGRSPMPISGAKVFNPGFSGPQTGSRPVTQNRNPQPREQSGNSGFNRSSPAKIYKPVERPTPPSQRRDNQVMQKPFKPMEPNYNKPSERPSINPLKRPSSPAKIYKPVERPTPPSQRRDNQVIQKPFKPMEPNYNKPSERPSINPLKRPSSPAKIYKPVERPSSSRIQPSSRPVNRPSSDSSFEVRKTISSPSGRGQKAPQNLITRESRESRDHTRAEDRHRDRDTWERRPSHHRYDRHRHHDWTDYLGIGFRYSWDDFSIYVNSGSDWRWDDDFYYYHSSPYWYWDTYYYNGDFEISYTSGYQYYRPYRYWVPGYWTQVSDRVSYSDHWGRICWRIDTRRVWVSGYWEYRSW